MAPIVDPADPVKIYVDPLTSGHGPYSDRDRTCDNGFAMAVIIRIYRKYGHLI